MKEAAAAVLVRHDVDRLGRASSASNESGSLELLLTLHALVGATICGARTDAAGQVERAVRCNRGLDSGVHTPHGRATVKVAMSHAAGPALRRCIRARGLSHPHPVQYSTYHGTRRFEHIICT